MTSSVDAERDKYSMINFEETELRLGLPGGSATEHHGESSPSSLMTRSSVGKRGFSETTDGDVDLKLNLSSSNNNDLLASASSTVAVDKAKDKSTAAAAAATTPPPPRAKAQVVGWPPVRSFRKNIVNVQSQRSNKKKDEEAEKKATAATTTTATTAAAALVKVSVDGAPYLRKVDLKLYKSYTELSGALGKMFSSSFTTAANNGKCGGAHTQASKEELMSDEEGKMKDLLKGSDSDYVPTYEDKDGDWMLVGDVPWEMFVESCKRLRVMKGSEAIGLAPRAVEKCKSRS